jgi:hypothetical protein
MLRQHGVGAAVNLPWDRGVVFCKARVAVALSAAVVGTAMAIALPAIAGADPEDCDETLVIYDPHDLVWDTDVLLDLGTLIDVESLVDDYTEKIDEALDAEFDNLEPPDGVSSDDLIDEARWEIKDALDLGRSIAGCED